MNVELQALKGSVSRDTFKQKHKEQLGNGYYACDLDLVLVEKSPFPDIIAALDYKKDSDTVTFSEVITYNALIARGIPVFIVKGDADTGRFVIQRYLNGNHYKPRCEVIDCCETCEWSEFKDWENSLRQEYKNRHRV